MRRVHREGLAGLTPLSKPGWLPGVLLGLGAYFGVDGAEAFGREIDQIKSLSIAMTLPDLMAS